jgi:hypothetical protein
LLSRPPTSCRSPATPISFIAAEYARSPSVTMLRGPPYVFMIRLRSFSAATLSRLAVTPASSTSPSSLANLGGEHRAKPIPPEPHGLMADVDPALGQEIFDVSKRQWKSTYFITTRRMTSGELLKYRNGLLMSRG